METKQKIPAGCGHPGLSEVPTKFNESHDGLVIIDSRLIAARCRVSHKNLIKRIRYHESVMEKLCGRVQFESGLAETNGGTQPVKYALLTEAQVALLLLLTTRGHERVAMQSAFKKALIDVFATVRETSVSHRPRKSTKFEIFKALAMAVGIAVIHGQFQTAINLLREVWIKARGASMSGCNQGGVRG